MKTKTKLKQGWNILLFYFSFLLLFFYLILGFLFLFTTWWIDMLPKGRGLIGLFLVLFGLFRFYISYRRYKNKKDRFKSITDQVQLKKEKQNVTTD